MTKADKLLQQCNAASQTLRFEIADSMIAEFCPNHQLQLYKHRISHKQVKQLALWILEMLQEKS